jgi:GDP-D-mannose 3',5'-epimerase
VVTVKSVLSTLSRWIIGIRSSTMSKTWSLDLNEKENCEIAAKGASDIYNLAANMGGMGFIEKPQSSLHAFGADQHTYVDGGAEIRTLSATFYSSSACVYNGQLQHTSRRR